MGYSHGTKWNEETIEKAIYEIMEIAKITHFPTRSTIRKITGNEALTNALRRHGGTRYWANKLQLEIKPCESRLGDEAELACMAFLSVNYGYDCEQTPVRYPYDILVNKNIKVDVKCSNLFHGKNGDFYTFNLGKSKPTCDIFVCYCIEEHHIEKVYVIPSCVLSGKTQLSLGVTKSKYEVFKNRWDIFEEYNAFLTSLTV